MDRFAKESGMPLHHPISIGQGFRAKKSPELESVTVALEQNFVQRAARPLLKQ